MHIKWNSTSIIRANVNFYGSKVTCVLHNIHLEGDLRVQLHEPSPTVPFYRHAHVSFVTPPDLDLETKFKDADIASVKMKKTQMGKMAGSIFRAKLIAELKTMALYPRYIVISL